MHTWISIDAAALKANLDGFGHLVGREKVMPVVKSNAYGHDFDLVASILLESLPAQIGVNYVQEGQRLRALGYQGIIVVLGPVFPRDLAIAKAYDLEVFLSGIETLDTWLASRERPKAHLKFDTGLSRQGFLSIEAPGLAAKIKSAKDDLVGICTHFANVEDVLEHGYAESQLREFNDALTVFRAAGFRVKAHAASSASALLLASSHFDLCRIGISLYGLWPSKSSRLSFLQNHKKLIDLKPVMSWQCEIATLKKIPAGRFVGYGCTFRAVMPMRLAVIPVGYFEGYPRIASNQGAYVLIRGQRCPLVGRISMNMSIVDVTHVHDISADDPVTLIGRDGGEAISASEFAEWAQTIHYEALTRLNPMIPRQRI